jgi:serine/threonine protein kinase
MSPRMLQPDALLGSYRLLARIGSGGMGEVWKAEDTRLGRTVAIKILPQAVAADAQAIARMKREARTAAQLYHPNIATIHAFEEADDRIFIVMEYVEGEPLTALIRRGPMAEADVCRIGRSVADALEAAHEKGIVHRDIKPDNIMVSGPRVKVLDFGIAKQVEPQGVNANDPTTVLTQQGMIIGTVFYMSPEQALGKQIDRRSDIFSLGAVMYEAVSGRRPFHGDTATDTITRIVRDEAPLPQSVSHGLASIISRCLRKERDDRFASARELADALEAQLAVAPTAPFTKPAAPTVRAAPTVITGAHPQPKSHNWMWVALIALLVIVIGLAAIVISQQRKNAAPAAAPQVASAPAPATTVTEPPPSTTTETVTAPLVIEEKKPTPVVPPPTTTTTSPPSPSPPPRTADDDYTEGIAHLVERDPARARASFESAIAKDPHHARAHFRLGEMAMFGRDPVTARSELEAALADADRLEPRERILTDAALALLDGDRVRARALIRELPGDPDVQRFRQMIEDLRETQRPVFRPRRLRPH